MKPCRRISILGWHDAHETYLIVRNRLLLMPAGRGLLARRGHGGRRRRRRRFAPARREGAGGDGDEPGRATLGARGLEL